MLSYHGKDEIKARLLKRIAAHAAADEIVQGQYWHNGKGCAIGCTYHTNGNHAEAETQAGIPMPLAWIEDTIFERLPNRLAKTWPMRFMTAIPVGVDLAMVVPRLLLWMLRDCEMLGTDEERAEAYVKRVGDLLEDWCRTGARQTVLAESLSEDVAVRGDAHLDKNRPPWRYHFAKDTAAVAAEYVARPTLEDDEDGAYKVSEVLENWANTEKYRGNVKATYHRAYIRASEKLLELIEETRR